MTTVSSVFDVDSILRSIGVDAKRTSSGEYKAHCPKHFERVGKLDRKPSWSINEETGSHHCFSCNYGGSIIDLVTDLTDMDPWEALRWLRSEGLQSLDVIYRDIVDAPDQPLANLAPTAQEEWMLFGTPPKRARQERLLSKKSCAHFDIRWTDSSWALPIKTWRGKLMGYQVKRGNFVLNQPETVLKSETLFGLDVFPAGEQVLLVESPLDAVRLWQSGYDAVSSYGVFVSNAQLELLQAFTDRIVVALDFDIAGRQEARRLYLRLRHTVPDLRFLNYRKAERREETGRRPKDVGEMTDEEIDLCVESVVTASEALALRLLASKEEMPDVHHRRSETKKRGRRGVRR